MALLGKKQLAFKANAYFSGQKKILPLKMRISFKASCFLPNKAMDRKLVPFQRVVLTLQNETNPGYVAQYVWMQCSFKVGHMRLWWIPIQQSTYSIWRRCRKVVFWYQL